jgi:hypothetical protein
MDCAACGTTLRPETGFCDPCGTPTTSPRPACGATNRPGARFRSECGPSLGADAPVASPPPPAERRQLTVLFCGLVGSTQLSSRLDPEDLNALTRAYQQPSGWRAGLLRMTTRSAGSRRDPLPLGIRQIARIAQPAPTYLLRFSSVQIWRLDTPRRATQLTPGPNRASPSP